MKKNIKCEECSYVSKWGKYAVKTMKKHKEANHEIKKFRCEKCNLFFSHAYKLKRHSCPSPSGVEAGDHCAPISLTPQGAGDPQPVEVNVEAGDPPAPASLTPPGAGGFPTTQHNPPSIWSWHPARKRTKSHEIRVAEAKRYVENQQKRKENNGKKIQTKTKKVNRKDLKVREIPGGFEKFNLKLKKMQKRQMGVENTLKNLQPEKNNELLYKMLCPNSPGTDFDPQNLIKKNTNTIVNKQNFYNIKKTRKQILFQHLLE